MTPRFALLLATVSLSGCGSPPPDVYALPLHTAYALLESRGLNDFAEARLCLPMTQIGAETWPDQRIRWRVRDGTSSDAWFAVKLSAVDAGHTRVEIELPPGPDGTGEAYDGKQPYKRPVLRAPLRPAVRELVDARLEDRQYDDTNVRERADETACDALSKRLESEWNASARRDTAAQAYSEDGE